uniref:Uncharacterized protein n=1 Tax=Avena sativa TaxID=4498 RepID=A0ACD5UZM1_AVESA
MQKYLNKTTVKMLAKYVQDRVGANVNDFYCTYAGKCLNEERLLSYYHIQRDSTIMVQHRLRAGVREQTIECLNWESAIDGIPRFHTVALPPDFVDAGTNRATAKYLSEAIQERSCQVLIALCEVHLRNFSLDGNFGPEHILFYKGRVFFDDAVREVRFSPVKGRRDYSRVYDIFLPVFRDEANPDDFPLHSPDLLDFLFACPPNFDLRSLTVVAYLINHSAIQTYTERISTCKTLESMVTRLFGIQLWRFQHLISHPDWLPIQNVPALHARYMYDPIWNQVMHKFVSKYGNDCRECLKLADNYFKHADDNIHMEVVEAAFSLAMSEDNFMPRLLQTLAALDPPLQDPRFDVVKVFGTHRVSCRPLQVAN